ncbi:uncharacterized protein LOC143294292 isoform X2 [Babylonia areolata]|uniref:uncharacterized protein LOC143294292 isoform X2 n=1 Tax=Babylonia areolata TaxID=304850 RepID=UPI003FD512AB
MGSMKTTGKNHRNCRSLTTTTTTTTTVHATPSSSSPLPLPLLLLLLLPGLLCTCSAYPLGTAQTGQDEKWRHPCSLSPSSSATTTSTSSSSTSSSYPSLPDIMGLLMNAARDAKHAASTWKNLLTSGANPRVVSSFAGMLENVIPVGKYFYPDNSSQSNVTEMLVNHYVVLSQMYILAAQCRVNSEACDTRGDSLLSDTDTTLHRVLSTLCQVDTFLTASGHPMPEHQVPDKDQVLEAWMTDLPRTCDEDDTSRVALDYVIARDSYEVLGRLYLKYFDLHRSLSNSSG